MIARLLYIGATHKTAALAVREQFAAGPEKIVHLLDRLHDVADERLVVSTCGRFELYLIQDSARHTHMPKYLSDALGLSAEVWNKHVRTLTGEAAARQALHVAAGLDSRIIGEPQILGQVRKSFDAARAAHATGPLLSALFRSAIHTGKRVRAETSLGRLARSFAGLAVDAIRESLGSPVGQAVAVFGTGAMAREAAALLGREPNCGLIVVSGHIDRANAIAREFGGRACALDSLPDVVAEADAMICCASSRWGVVELSLARQSIARPLVIVDLGMPRNVDPSVEGLPGVRLIDLDHLPGASAPGQAAVAQAERIVEDELQRLLTWIRHRRVAPLIARLTKSVSTRAHRRALHQIILQLKEGAAA